MIVFRPRLAAFYLVVLATIVLLSNRVTVSSQNATAEVKPTTIVDTSE